MTQQQLRVQEILAELKEVGIIGTQVDNYLGMYKGTAGQVKAGLRNYSDKTMAKLEEFYAKKCHKKDQLENLSRLDQLEQNLNCRLTR